MTIDLYYIPGSAPCRSVQMVAKALGVDLNLKLTNLMAGEQLKPDYIKMNPQHTVPTLDDNGFYLWESRAILTYLVQAHGKNDSLYPKDPKKRATVDQRLYFDQGTLYQRFGDYVYPHYFGGAPLDPEKLKKIDEALEWLNTYLEGNDWVAGDQMTVADMTIAATISTIDIVGIDVNKHANVARWYASAKKTIPGYDINQAGAAAFKEMVDHLTAKK